MSERKYLVEEEKAIKAARDAYKEALVKLQEECEHNAILEHTSNNYEEFRVCEDCGTTCRAPWGSPVSAYGNVAILSKRAYTVGWTEFATATPKVGGWCQSTDNPRVFTRGGKK